MKIRNLFFFINCLCLALTSLAAQTNQLVIFPGDDPLNPQNFNLVWPATPGLRYEVQQSTNLQSWSTAPGYPATAFGPAQQMPFSTAGTAGFYRVNQLDDQPPIIASQYPADGGFAVSRFANLTLQLADATGIDTTSLQLTIGSLGTFTLTNAQLTFSNNLITFINGGSVPLGAWGTNIQATLVMSDALGHFTTNIWSFTLEVQPQTVTNLFVFGSPHAQGVGQRIGNIPTRVLAARAGPIPADSGDPWTLAQVATNFIVLAYTNTTPVFTVGQYVCNLTPVSPAEIFNRKITAISDDPGKKLLTLSTVEVPLAEIATNGSASVSSDSMILQMDTNGVFNKAFSISGALTFPRIGYSLDAAQFVLKDLSDFEIAKLTMEEEHWWLTPRLQTSIEINWGSLQRFEAIASGNIDQASVWSADVLLTGIAITNTLFQLPEAVKEKAKVWMFLGSIGPVPVYASLGFDLKLKARAEALATLNFRTGERQTVDASFGVTYSKPDDPQWVHTFNFPPPEIIPFTANINGEGSIKVSLEPSVEFLVYGAAGVSAGVAPSGGVVFTAGTGQPLSGKFVADVSLDLGLAGPLFDVLPVQPTFSLPLWSDEWHLFPDLPNISFEQQPQSQTITSGGSAYFYCTVAATGTPSYQWYFGGVPIPGQTSRTLSLPSVNSGHAGNYYVRVSAGGQTTNSATATLTVIPKSVQSGLVAWYPFNGNANDASGNGNNGIVNGATLSTDRFGNANAAYDFNGISSYIDIPQNAILNGLTTNFTLSAWIYQRGINQNFGYRIIDKCPAGLPDGWTFDTWDGSSYRRLRLQAAGSYNPNVIGATFYSLMQWHHVVATVSGTTGKVYLDGNLDGSGDVGSIPQNMLDVFIGRANIGCGGGCGIEEFFNGLIDEVRIYNRALSDSEILQLYNASLPVPAPSAGMALIPAGSFTMGNNLDENGSELPLHTVYVSAFYMDKYDVTKSLWDSVYAWAITHGYSFDHTGLGKAANHPVQTVDWYDCVKWCNARSEKEGKIPAYYTSAAQTTVYRSGQVNVDNDSVKWSSGYRLPTEAEWEKAARRGASGRRFPWGNTISWSQANYYAYPSGYAYDINPTQGYHPSFNYGVWPFTSPANYFAPNGYGLYDMAGNVWQWCWDWYDSYGSASQTDPRGPSGVLSDRVLRGGGWSLNVNYDAPRCAFRNHSINGPDYADSALGFRCVLSLGQ